MIIPYSPCCGLTSGISYNHSLFAVTSSSLMCNRLSWKGFSYPLLLQLSYEPLCSFKIFAEHMRHSIFRSFATTTTMIACHHPPHMMSRVLTLCNIIWWTASFILQIVWFDVVVLSLFCFPVVLLFLNPILSVRHVFLKLISIGMHTEKIYKNFCLDRTFSALVWSVVYSRIELK